MAYSDANCTNPAVATADVGNFVIGSTVQEDILEINLRTTSAAVEPVSDAGASILNSASFCGITNWIEDIPRDITSRVNAGACEGVGLNKFSVVRVSETTLAIARPSGTQSGNTLETRSTNINQADTFTKTTLPPTADRVSAIRFQTEKPLK